MGSLDASSVLYRLYWGFIERKLKPNRAGLLNTSGPLIIRLNYQRYLSENLPVKKIFPLLPNKNILLNVYQEFQTFKTIFMQTLFNKHRSLKTLVMIFLLAAIVVSCKKSDLNNQPAPEINVEQEALNAARTLENTAAANAANEGNSLNLDEGTATRGNRNIVQIVVANPNFAALEAAVLKTGLAGALSNASANLTLFAPTNSAFAQLPAPFNNASNISAITDAGQISFLTNVLLYHVLGAEVFSNQIANGRSSAVTLKTAGQANDNTVYFSKTFGLIRINGQTDVIAANINASNGVIHAVNKVLLFPTNTIAGIAIANPNFSVLVAALVKTNLASVFTGAGDFTVFAPTNAAFAELPAPFNNAANIAAISSQAQIDALSNILRYHVVASRNFAWDLGILRSITTLANTPNNRVTTILGYNIGFVKGNTNNNFATANPADILATNGVIQVVNKVLLP